MQSHQDRVDKLIVHGEQIVRQYKTNEPVQGDLNKFAQRWQKAFNKMGKHACCI